MDIIPPVSPAYTLINPQNGNLAFKIFAFEDNRHFDHIQRLNYYSVLLITSGGGRLQVDFSEYGFEGSALMFFSPYQPFMLQKAGSVKGYAIHFHPDFFCIHDHHKEVACHGVLFNNIYQSPVLEVPEPERNALLFTIDEMKTEVRDRGLAQSEMLVSLLKILLIRSARLRNESGAKPVLSESSDHRTQILRSLKDAIENHYRSHHGAGEYAALLNISSKVLGRVTKSCLNKTVSNLISERIVIEAKRELYMTSKTIKEIAWILGFEDEYYFSRFFKVNTDVSPQLFRGTVGFARAEPTDS